MNGKHRVLGSTWGLVAVCLLVVCGCERGNEPDSADVQIKLYQTPKWAIDGVMTVRETETGSGVWLMRVRTAEELEYELYGNEDAKPETVREDTVYKLNFNKDELEIGTVEEWDTAVSEPDFAVQQEARVPQKLRWSELDQRFEYGKTGLDSNGNAQITSAKAPSKFRLLLMTKVVESSPSLTELPKNRGPLGTIWVETWDYRPELKRSTDPFKLPVERSDDAFYAMFTYDGEYGIISRLDHTEIHVFKVGSSGGTKSE